MPPAAGDAWEKSELGGLGRGVETLVMPWSHKATKRQTGYHLPTLSGLAYAVCVNT